MQKVLSMKNQFFATFGIAVVFAASFMFVPASRASDTAACQLPPPQVQITVDSVKTSLANFVKESSRIAPGKEHDALLLAAFLKDGAQVTHEAQITTTDGVMGRLEQTFPSIPALTSFVEVKPLINKNSSITVDISYKLETLSPIISSGAVSPSTITNAATVTDTFTNGQTAMVSISCDGANPAFLLFAQVKSPANFLPAPVLPLTHP